MNSRLMVNMSIIPDAQEREIMRSLLRHQIDTQTAISQLGDDPAKFNTLVKKLQQTAQPYDPARVNQPNEESEAEIAARLNSFFDAMNEMLWED
ncbi:MAG TPA: hypothetical protein V6D33_10155 [Cyanophyceae cyanobacterium]